MVVFKRAGGQGVHSPGKPTLKCVLTSSLLSEENEEMVAFNMLSVRNGNIPNT